MGPRPSSEADSKILKRGEDVAGAAVQFGEVRVVRQRSGELLEVLVVAARGPNRGGDDLSGGGDRGGFGRREVGHEVGVLARRRINERRHSPGRSAVCADEVDGCDAARVAAALADVELVEDGCDAVVGHFVRGAFCRGTGLLEERRDEARRIWRASVVCGLLGKIARPAVADARALLERHPLYFGPPDEGAVSEDPQRIGHLKVRRRLGAAARIDTRPGVPGRRHATRRQPAARRRKAAHRRNVQG
mmetsp:Transcript_25836/g.86843  ORF Transcript_25836/g.86843 Transcript_25836/m.86843 type:complete len:247 (-) Transcript_25836:50-790(-)